MKTCGRCGEEIGTKDGDNFCDACELAAEKCRRRRTNRREREAVLRSLGMAKVRGALGGTYWE